jgi:hypothetical protein
MSEIYGAMELEMTETDHSRTKNFKVTFSYGVVNHRAAL